MITSGPLDCGSGCRGFETRHSPLNTAETPSGSIPLAPPSALECTGYSSDLVQQGPEWVPNSGGLGPASGSDPTVRIPLGKSGRFALVDAADAERVSQFRWHLKSKRSQPGKLYAQRSLPRAERSAKASESLHAFVLGSTSGHYIDHLSGDSLDNRRANLRLCTPRENATNVTSSKRQKLGGYKGVTWNKAASKWQASICAGEIKPNGKRRQIYLGVFSDPIAAARAYDRKALECFGPFASLNFPDSEATDFAAAVAEDAERASVVRELARPLAKPRQSSGYVARKGRAR